MGKPNELKKKELPFIEDRVIDTWLTSTSQLRRNQLQKQQDRLIELRELLKHKKHIFQCLHVLRTNYSERGQAEQELEYYQQKNQETDKEINRNRSNLLMMEGLLRELETISTLDDVKAYQAISNWVARLPGDLQSNITQFILTELKGLEKQWQYDLSSSNIPSGFRNRKTFIKPISELHKMRPGIGKEIDQNGKLIEYLCSILFKAMGLLDVSRELNWAQSRLIDYRSAFNSVSSNDSRFIKT